jgi:hypothetical protein
VLSLKFDTTDNRGFNGGSGRGEGGGSSTMMRRERGGGEEREPIEQIIKMMIIMSIMGMWCPPDGEG